jgi:hypothetical protein
MLLDLRSLEEASGTVTYSYTGSGGIVFAGQAAEKFAWKYTVAGGIVFGGQEAEKFVFKYTPSGGIVFAGHATQKRSFAYDPTGGIVFGGTMDESLTRDYVPTGGVVFSGAATTVFEPHGTNVFVYAGSGGILFGGAATTVGPSAVADSRGWSQLRRHARARPEHVTDAVAVASSLSREVRADSSVSVVGSVVRVSAGFVSVYTDVSIAAKPPTLGSAVRVARGVVQVQSDARIEAISTSVYIQTSSVSVLGSTVIPIRGQRIRTAVGRVSVEIGPDLVQAEEDELFFLLEVA